MPSVIEGVEMTPTQLTEAVALVARMKARGLIRLPGQSFDDRDGNGFDVRASKARRLQEARELRQEALTKMDFPSIRVFDREIHKLEKETK